ncbi:hypothetical protein QJQ45_012464 [Haematococcus lacustris]|nr:hypothetical protein QJQ45_012464 [Haematococcus lacustris]
MQRIGESRWRPLELCYWPDQGALPAKGKEYPGLGYKRLRDKPPKAQQQQPAEAHRAQGCVEVNAVAVHTAPQQHDLSVAQSTVHRPQHVMQQLLLRFEPHGRGLPTVPSSLGEEKATNPFLRPHDAGIRSCLGVGPEASDVEVFTRLRHAKDSFH